MAGKKTIQERVLSACEQILRLQHYISLTEVFKTIGILQPFQEDNWRNGKIDSLESVLQGSPEKILEAIKWVDMWVAREGLIPIEIEPYARTSGPKRLLKYTEDADPENEYLFKTYYFSPELPEKELQKILNKLQK